MFYVITRKNAWRYGRVRSTLTFQKEVAVRMAAPIMTKERCRLSIMCQNWCKIEHKFNIPGITTTEFCLIIILY